ncbi:sulfite exporter TauE/SafE family protein [uncultured Mucilaginibacter sp.]|uniref:sulfite exporter TauE/SafE family protein n=1 Tax=uncultured Mucilaginibacter sp. TaxID=797541 RepID=UPI0025F544B2|nr:sulfite exporter TauE/SafE family protein [uncultured Mucilaginibacter sp.]
MVHLALLSGNIFSSTSGVYTDLFLLAAGLFAGMINAVAGGGTFISMPVLIYAGLPSVQANASSTVALFPGSLASIYAYREDFKSFEKISLKTLIIISLTGGCIGAFLLILTPARNFDKIIPWLILLGSVTFIFGKQAGRLLQRKFTISRSSLIITQFVLGIYGGYFGGGAGIMMMAVWSVFGFTDIKLINVNKTLLVGAANSIAVVVFIISGKIWWTQTCIMLIATTIGGYAGAYYARRLNQNVLRGVIIFLIVLITVFFSYRAYK